MSGGKGKAGSTEKASTSRSSKLVWLSQSEESTDCWERVTTPKESVPVPQSTWPPSWSTWLPKSWSWLVTLPETTRSPESSQDTCNWPSETMRSWTSCWATSLLPKVVFCQTSTNPCCQPRSCRQGFSGIVSGLRLRKLIFPRSYIIIDTMALWSPCGCVY